MTKKEARSRQSESNGNEEKDFFIVCPLITNRSGVLESLYALYYLPPRFKLVLPDSVSTGRSRLLLNNIRMIVRTESLQDRVYFRNDLQSFSHPRSSVVICSSSPESLASTMLRIAK